MDSETIQALVQAAVDEFNESLEAEEQLPNELTTPLIGDEGRLDSVGLVGLLVLVEEKLEDACGRSVTLADERAFSQAKSPFLTLRTLVDYVGALLAEGDG